MNKYNEKIKVNLFLNKLSDWVVREFKRILAKTS